MVNPVLRASLCVSLFVSASLPAQGPVPTRAWAPKPTKTPAYSPPQQPWIKLSDLKAKHEGEARWRELLVDDGRLTAEYFAAAPGTKVGRRFHPDTREWFAVVEGEVRVEIEGQEPFTARRGSLVNIPRQTIYSLETIGDTPSVRFAVNVAGAKTLFPQDAERPVSRRMRNGLRRRRARRGCRSRSPGPRRATTSSTSRI
jgi:quercetin dioxygenase-like cupin family protein